MDSTDSTDTVLFYHYGVLLTAVLSIQTDELQNFIAAVHGKTTGFEDQQL